MILLQHNGLFFFRRLIGYPGLPAVLEEDGKAFGWTQGYWLAGTSGVPCYLEVPFDA